METNPLVSIVILDYGDIKWLNQCLDTIDFNQAQVLIVDNNKTNRGFAKGNNLGAKQAKGKYLLFLNNDTKVSKDSLKPMTDKMESNPNIGICTPKILDYEGNDIEQRIGRSCDIYGWQAWEGPTFFAEGSCMMIRADLFFKLGGFDERYFAYLEDLDLCWRARLLGYEISEVPESIIYHYSGASTTTSRGRKDKFVTNRCRLYHGIKNQLRTLLKNYGKLALIKVLPKYLLISLCEMSYLLMTLNLRILLIYLRAYLWNIFYIGDTLRLRKQIQSTRTISDKQIQSIMVRYSSKIETIKRIGLPKFK